MAGVGSITVPLETVTPLFLAGADPRGAPELRPPSFRGALRYWLRAAIGGATGGNLAEVRRVESAVFGSTEGGFGGAGAVSIRIRHGQLPEAKSAPRLKRPPSGSDYLYWSMAPSGNRERGNDLPAKQYLPPSAVFDLVFARRPGSAAGDAAMQKACAALWLLVQLGGVGSRAHRTGGSLCVRGVIEAHGLAFGLKSGTLQGLAAEVAEGLQRVASLVGASWDDTSPHATFDLLHPRACRLWVLDLWRDAEDAREAVGRRLSEGRRSIQFDQRTTFGLPLQKVRAVGNARPQVERRASPLWLSVGRIQGGKATVIATLFDSQLLPHGTKLHTPNGESDPPSDVHVIHRWVQSAFPNAQEVNFG